MGFLPIDLLMDRGSRPPGIAGQDLRGPARRRHQDAGRMEFGKGRYHRGERRRLARTGIAVDDQDIGIVPRQELAQVPQEAVLARRGFIGKTPQEFVV